MFFIALSLLYIDPEMGGGGRFGERFKMSAHSPFWSSREFFMITCPIQTLSSVPVFLDKHLFISRGATSISDFKHGVDITSSSLTWNQDV